MRRLLLFAILLGIALGNPVYALTITLNYPPNNAQTVDTTPTFKFTPTGSSSYYNCTLYIDGTNYGEATNIPNNTAAEITPTTALSTGDHNWNITCEGVGTTETGTSATRVVGIGENFSRCATFIDGGTYYLVEDIINTSTGSCITIDTNDVVLDCLGHTIDGDTHTSMGIDIMKEHNNITIINCTVRDFTDYQVQMYPVDGLTIKNLYLGGEGDYAMWIEGKNITIDNLTVSNSILIPDITLGNSINNLLITNSYIQGQIEFDSGTFTNITINRSKIEYSTPLDIPSSYRTYSNMFIYNNYIQGSPYVESVSGVYFNITKQEGDNIYNQTHPFIGGNFWAKSDGTGYSQTCRDDNIDGFCDDPYSLSADNKDYLPLSKYYEYVRIYPEVKVTGLPYNYSGVITIKEANSEYTISKCWIGSDIKDYSSGISFNVNDIRNNTICCNTSSSPSYTSCYDVLINITRNVSTTFYNNSKQRIDYVYDIFIEPSREHLLPNTTFPYYLPVYNITFSDTYYTGNRLSENQLYKDGTGESYPCNVTHVVVGDGIFFRGSWDKEWNYYFDPFYNNCSLVSVDWKYYELFDNAIWASYEGDWLKEEKDIYQNTSVTSNLTRQYVDVKLTVNNTADVTFYNVTEFISCPGKEAQGWAYPEFKYRIKAKLTNPSSTALTDAIIPIVLEDRWILRARVTNETGSEIPFFLERSFVSGHDSIIHIKTDLPANSEKYIYIYFTEDSDEASSISTNSNGSIFKDYDGFEGQIDSNWYFDDPSIWHYNYSSYATEGDYVLAVDHPGTGSVYMYRNISIEDGDFISMYLLYYGTSIYLNYTTGEVQIPPAYKLFRYPISRSGYLSDFPILTYGKPSVDTANDLIKIRVAIPGRLDYAQSAKLEEVSVNGQSISTCNGGSLPLSIPLNDIYDIECNLSFNATEKTPLRAIYKFNISFSRLVGYPYDHRYVIADILPTGNYTLKIGVDSSTADTIAVLDSYKISNFAYMDNLSSVVYEAHNVALHDRMPLHMTNVTAEGSYVNFTLYLDKEYKGWLGKWKPINLVKGTMNGVDITTCEGQSLPIEINYTAYDELFEPHDISCSKPTDVYLEEWYNFSHLAIVLNISNIRGTFRLLDTGDLKYRLSYISFDYYPLNKNITQRPLLYEVYSYVQDKYNDTIEISSLAPGVSTYKKQYTGDWLQEVWKNKEQDPAQTSNLSRQYLRKPLQVNNTLSIDFSNVEWSYSPEPSETCVVCSGSLNIPAQGTSSTYAQVYGDWIDDTYEWEQNTDETTVAGGKAYIKKIYNLTNTHSSVNFTDIEIPYSPR